MNNLQTLKVPELYLERESPACSDNEVFWLDIVNDVYSEKVTSNVIELYNIPLSHGGVIIDLTYPIPFKSTEYGKQTGLILINGHAYIVSEILVKNSEGKKVKAAYIERRSTLSLGAIDQISNIARIPEIIIPNNNNNPTLSDINDDEMSLFEDGKATIAYKYLQYQSALRFFTSDFIDKNVAEDRLIEWFDSIPHAVQELDLLRAFLVVGDIYTRLFDHILFKFFQANPGIGAKWIFDQLDFLFRTNQDKQKKILSRILHPDYELLKIVNPESEITALTYLVTDCKYLEFFQICERPNFAYYHYLQQNPAILNRIRQTAKRYLP